MDDKLRDTQVSELGELKKGRAKKRKTGLLAPIIYIIIGVGAWMYSGLQQIFADAKLFAELSCNGTKIFDANSVSELGTSINNGDSIMEIIKANSVLFIAGLILIILAVLTVIGICMLITRIARRAKNKIAGE